MSTKPDELAQYFTENNMPIPAPLTGMSLIDTGASKTAVDVLSNCVLIYNRTAGYFSLSI